MTTYGRIEHHPVLGSLKERSSISFFFDEREFTAYESETVASALLANGVRTLRVQEETGAPRGIYCNIGHCYECRVTVNGVQGKRACLTLVESGMKITSGIQLPTPLQKGAVQR
ncbi:sarcosine oxidase subunit alpha [Brevibacillus reuszeri]|uniref:Sarcosine oxidase subunit alpha n=1 Tax=Brevibacillus reuszeri TaxID=54915 RepID=A0A0K9YKI4_9BACL|nr:(2Fe-2S)-binding protein [Brevibacillus reuszeri]KNB69268.1 sarcosine oxidase subunit alpha [Brevibacillus reuszeri]MED1860214.1 (2Fe-2S)-binding protein [Brevibacillus reuszeri]GED71587.1 sarcosine oxidase subunit alpha [Brevibacillus reuszeri]